MSDKDIQCVKEAEVFVLDLDGTLYRGNTLIDGTKDFLQAAKNAGKRLLYFTNNSSRSPESCIKKLNGFGIDVTREDVMTSTDVILAFLKEQAPDKNVYLVGTPDLEDCFRKEGIHLTNHDTATYDYTYGLTANAFVAKDEQPDIVVVGFDVTFNYEKMERASAYIQKGAAFYGIHPDITCPMEHGSIPDCGAIVASIELTTGKKARYFGKPYEETVEAVMKTFDVPREKIAFVGDRLYTDIAAGTRNGALGILVLTGETSLEESKASDIKPDAVFPSVKEMAEVLRC